MEKLVRYTFGESEKAARRLEAISEFFDPLSQKFVSNNLERIPKSAVDLGCGPGYSTRMLANATRSERRIGLDRSREFLARAHASFPEFHFVETDLVRAPLPLKSDVLFCRFLLSHLPDPMTRVSEWRKVLNPSGLLFIDELEGIDTEVPVFRKYLDVQTWLVGSQGASLFAGPLLSAEMWRSARVTDYIEPIPVANSLAASWFHPNTLIGWKSERGIQTRFGATFLEEISKELDSLKDRGDGEIQSLWRMRRLVLRS